MAILLINYLSVRLFNCLTTQLLTRLPAHEFRQFFYNPYSLILQQMQMIELLYDKNILRAFDV
jgi:hypothetical protein